MLNVKGTLEPDDFPWFMLQMEKLETGEMMSGSAGIRMWIPVH